MNPLSLQRIIGANSNLFCGRHCTQDRRGSESRLARRERYAMQTRTCSAGGIVRRTGGVQSPVWLGAKDTRCRLEPVLRAALCAGQAGFRVPFGSVRKIRDADSNLFCGRHCTQDRRGSESRLARYQALRGRTNEARPRVSSALGTRGLRRTQRVRVLADSSERTPPWTRRSGVSPRSRSTSTVTPTLIY